MRRVFLFEFSLEPTSCQIQELIQAKTLSWKGSELFGLDWISPFRGVVILMDSTTHWRLSALASLWYWYDSSAQLEEWAVTQVKGNIMHGNILWSVGSWGVCVSPGTKGHRKTRPGRLLFTPLRVNNNRTVARMHTNSAAITRVKVLLNTTADQSEATAGRILDTHLSCAVCLRSHSAV